MAARIAAPNAIQPNMDRFECPLGGWTWRAVFFSAEDTMGAAVFVVYSAALSRRGAAQLRAPWTPVPTPLRTLSAAAWAASLALCAATCAAAAAWCAAACAFFEWIALAAPFTLSVAAC